MPIRWRARLSIAANQFAAGHGDARRCGIELAPHGIHVVGVYPTDVDTPCSPAKNLHPPEEDALQGTVRPISPEVVVDAILDGLRRRRGRIYPGRRTSALAHLVTAAPELATRYANLALVKTRLRRMQYRPGLLDGFLTRTGLDLTPLSNPNINDR